MVKCIKQCFIKTKRQGAKDKVLIGLREHDLNLHEQTNVDNFFLLKQAQVTNKEHPFFQTVPKTNNLWFGAGLTVLLVTTSSTEGEKKKSSTKENSSIWLNQGS